MGCNKFETSNTKANKISNSINIEKRLKINVIVGIRGDMTMKSIINWYIILKIIKIYYLNIIADWVLFSMNNRFIQFTIYIQLVFLCNIGKLRTMNDNESMKNCLDLWNYLSDRYSWHWKDPKQDGKVWLQKCEITYRRFELERKSNGLRRKEGLMWNRIPRGLITR